MRILQWLILGLPWVIVAKVQHPFLLPKEAVLCVGMWAVIITTLFRNQPAFSMWSNPHVKWFLLWVLVQGAYLYWWLMVQQKPGSQEFTWNFQNWVPTIHVLTAAVFVYVLACYHLPRKDLSLLVAQWLCWSGVLVSIYALGQRLGYDQLFNRPEVIAVMGDRDVPSKSWMIGAIGNVNYLATYLAPLLPLYFIFRQRRYLVYVAIVVLTLVIAQVKFAWLAAVFGVMAYGWLRWWHRDPKRHRLQLLLLVMFAFSLAALLLSYLDVVMMEERWGVWTHMLRQLRIKGVTGLGIGNFYMVFHVHWDRVRSALPFSSQASSWQWAHNDALQLFYELGAVGAVLMALVLWKALKLAWEKSSTSTNSAWLASGLSMGVLSVTNFPWHVAPCALTGLLILAMWHAPVARGGS